MTHQQSFFPAAVARTQAPVSSSAELALTLLGPSSAMAQLWGQIRRLAPHVRTLLLTGEPDCGQEAVARLLLDLSLHAHRSFVQLSAPEAEARIVRASGFASLPADLLLFVPDVDRFSHAAQDGLLRLMRMRRARPFTVVAATSVDLRVLVGTGRFSAELADALTSVRIALPALRQRPEDIPMLVGHLLTTYSQKNGGQTPHVTEDFLQAAMQHPWSGNLRELAQTLLHLATTMPGQELHAADLRRALATQEPHRPQSTAAAARLIPLETVMQEHINAVLHACRGNKLRAAEVLGISRSTLYRMLDTASVAHPSSLPMAS